MILRNSITKYICTQNGRRTYHLRAFLNPIQMNLGGDVWQDIKPRLVRDADGWHIEGAPYYAEVKDTGERLFCPDRTDRSKYIRLPTIALLSGLTKNVISSPTQLDKSILDNQIVMPTAWGYIQLLFKNDKVAFHIQVNKTPPISTLRIPVDATFDIAKLLASKTGLVIPTPKIIDAQGNQIDLAWAFKNGELSLDLPDIAPPYTFKNASFAVGASTDDCNVYDSDGVPTWIISLTSAHQMAGYFGSGNRKTGGGMKYDGVNIPAGATMLTSILTFVASLSSSGTNPKSGICGELNASAATFGTLADYQARRGTDIGGANNNNRTTARVLWDDMASWTAGTTYNSPDFISVTQEMVDTIGALTNIVIFWDDHDSRTAQTTGKYRSGASWNNATYDPPVFDATWSSGWGGEFCGVAVAEFDGVTPAEIDGV